MENYNSYILGSVNIVSNCLNIVLYKKSSFSDKISLYNIKNFYNNNLSESSDKTKYVRLTRRSSEDLFYYNRQLKDGFDVIVYIGPSSMPVGYTEFVFVQGTLRSLSINVEIQRELETEDILGTSTFTLSVILENSIVRNNLDKNYSGTNLYNYPTVSEVIGKINPNQYTTDIERVVTDPKSNILLSYGAVTSDGLWKLKINKNINLDPRKDLYKKYRVCYYNGDLVIAGWDGRDTKSYTMFSLIKTNYLEYPLVYRGTTEKDIKEILGKYYIDPEDKMVDIDTGIEVSGVYDSHSIDGEVYDLPTFYTKEEAIKAIPDINNIFLDIDNYLKSYQLIIYRKIGSWFILKQLQNNTYIYLAVSPTMSIYLSEEDLDKLIFVNDQTVLLKENSYKYYVLYNRPGNRLYTERALLTISGNKSSELVLYDDTVYLSPGYDNEEHYQDYYSPSNKDRKADLIFFNEDLNRTSLNRYRKYLYPNVSGIPNIIDSYCGIIFYINENTINYL